MLPFGSSAISEPKVPNRLGFRFAAALGLALAAYRRRRRHTPSGIPEIDDAPKKSSREGEQTGQNARPFR
jgi:hypothetical protein